MTTASDASRMSGRPPRRWERTFVRLFMKHAHVTKAETVAEGFRLITLESPEFKELHWVPGQKLQITMGSAFIARTFTPIEWDPARGQTRILGYAHGKGPGSAWICDAQPGLECDVFGPRASLDIGSTTNTHVVLGDETSIGLAYAVDCQTLASPLSCLLEVNTAAHARDVLAHLRLDGAALFERRGNDTHLEDIERRLPALVAIGASFVLTGKAASIKRWRRALKALGTPTSRLMTKPYWAPGRTGLD